MGADLLAGASKTGGAAPTRLLDSQALSFRSATEFGFSGPRSNSNLVSSALTQLQTFDTPDNRMQTHVWDRMGRSASFYNSGGTPLSRPRVLSPSIGLLLKQLGASSGTLEP